MTTPFPSPTVSRASRADVFTSYLDYFRERLISKLNSLPPESLRTSMLPSGWAPIELLKHLGYVERRWLEWGALIEALQAQAAVTDTIVARHELAETGCSCRRVAKELADGGAPARQRGVPSSRA
jgi:Protein of unknown function (DUF664)